MDSGTCKTLLGKSKLTNVITISWRSWLARRVFFFFPTSLVMLVSSEFIGSINNLIDMDQIRLLEWWWSNQAKTRANRDKIASVIGNWLYGKRE